MTGELAGASGDGDNTFVGPLAVGVAPPQPIISATVVAIIAFMNRARDKWRIRKSILLVDHYNRPQMGTDTQ